MNVLITLLFATFLSLSAFAGLAQASGANSACTTVSTGTYTSRESCVKITVDKKVFKPGTSEYVDGLSATDPKYGIDQNVTFQIVVKNVGDEKLTDITVVDVLPQNVTYVSGAGSYDQGRNELSFKIANLEVGKAQEFFIVAKTTNSISFGDKGFVCVTNLVRVKANKDISSEDSAQFCVERPLVVHKPVPVKKTPPTGPLDAALPILMGMGGAGMYLIRKVK